jgi:hypothetical protein
MTWIEFKPLLFEMMEQRRARQLMFHTEQIYSLIVGCSKQFNTTKKSEAEQALNRIQDEGTFLLAVDAFSELLLVLFPETQSSESQSTSTGLTTGAIAAGPLLRPDQDVVPINERQVLNPSHPTADARRGSGRPFRR